MLTGIVTDRRAWTGADFASKKDVAVTLGEREVRALTGIADALRARGLKPAAIDPRRDRFAATAPSRAVRPRGERPCS